MKLNFDSLLFLKQFQPWTTHWPWPERFFSWGLAEPFFVLSHSYFWNSSSKLKRCDSCAAGCITRLRNRMRGSMGTQSAPSVFPGVPKSTSPEWAAIFGPIRPLKDILVQDDSFKRTKHRLCVAKVVPRFCWAKHNVERHLSVPWLDDKLKGVEKRWG